jgi:hypothetical protein
VAKGGGEEGVGEGVAVDGWPNQDDGPTGRKRNSCMRFPFIFFIRKKKENKRKGAGRRRADSSDKCRGEGGKGDVNRLGKQRRQPPTGWARARILISIFREERGPRGGMRFVSFRFVG